MTYILYFSLFFYFSIDIFFIVVYYINMPKKYGKDYKVISVPVKATVLDGFERLYPATSKMFCARALEFALKSQGNFMTIFFDKAIENNFMPDEV